MQEIPLIFTLFIVASIGLILYFFENIPKKFLHLLIALWAGTMFAVALVHILPEAMETSKIAIYSFVWGFLMMYLFEELLTPHHHDHTHLDHTHEDPHEHLEHIIIVSWIAISIHTIFDGLWIRAGFALSESLGMGILGSVAIHQIPVSLSVASLLRESHFSKKIQVWLMIIFACTAPCGFVLADTFVSHISTEILAITTAIAGWSLLYVSNVELLPMIHAESSKHMKYATTLLFVWGVIGMTLIAIFE